MNDSIRVDIHPLAAAEIEEADEWYFNVDPKVAASFREAVYLAMKKIGEQPLTYPVFETSLRRYVLQGFPYVILFHATGPRVRVIAVAHTRRRPGYWKDRAST